MNDMMDPIDKDNFDVILNDIKNKILEFKKYLEVVDGTFLSKHLKGKIFHKWITYRDPDKNWFAKDFYPILEEECIPSEFNQKDEYVSELLYSFKESHENKPYDEIDDAFHLYGLVELWKRDIIHRYSRIEHIKRFVWSMLPYSLVSKGKRNQFFERIFNLANELLLPQDPIQFKEFETNGFFCEIVNFDCSEYYCQHELYYNEVKIKGLSGLWGNFVSYYQNKSAIDNYGKISIPEKIYKGGLRDLRITSIGDGLFNNLTQVETIELPNTIKHAKWSFWHCRKLKNIIVKPYGFAKFSSIDGVLFSGDKKVLLAYPNMHGIEYSVPEGVVKIGNCAFKDSSQLEELHLPASITHIGINAFYRCTNLKRIVCAGVKDSIEVEGTFGAAGSQIFEWVYKN